MALGGTKANAVSYIDGDWYEGNPPIMGPLTHAAWLGSIVFDGARAFDGATPDLDYSKAVACTGKAGSCSFHHVRLVHGSSENNSDKQRSLLLFECAAADAWPLLRFTTLEELDSRMICGESTIEPRSERVPIRMPLPPALAEGSIYENQTALRNRYFETKRAAT